MLMNKLANASRRNLYLGKKERKTGEFRYSMTNDNDNDNDDDDDNTDNIFL